LRVMQQNPQYGIDLRNFVLEILISEMKTVVNHSTENEKLRTLVERNPQKTVRELSEQLHVSISIISRTLAR